MNKIIKTILLFILVCVVAYALYLVYATWGEHPRAQYTTPEDKSCDYPDSSECEADSNCWIKELHDVQDFYLKPWTCCPNEARKAGYVRDGSSACRAFVG